MNRNKTGKSQVTLLYFLLIFLKEILLTHFQNHFGRSNCDVLLENEGKIYYMKEDMSEFFSLICRLASRNFITN